MAGSDPRPSGWRSYDSVADAYDQAAVPRFLPLARDLVAAVAPAEGARVLDVGTGTGLAAHVASEWVGPQGFVVGVDPSVGMLERAAARGITVVVGMFPGLPFRDEAFHAVLANLVLSHLGNYELGIADAVRVLRAGGQFGCTAWGPAVPGSDEHQGPQADEIVESLITAHGLDLTPPGPPAVPSEEPLRVRENLEAALRGAGLVEIVVEPRTYHSTSSIDDHLLGREWRPGVRYIRQQTDAQFWRKIQRRAASQLRDRFGDEIRSMGQAWVAVGTKA